TSVRRMLFVHAAWRCRWSGRAATTDGPRRQTSDVAMHTLAGRTALQPMEARLGGAARARHGRVAVSVRHASPPDALLSPLGSVRDGRPRRHGLQPLARGTHLPARTGAAVRWTVPRHVQGLPAAPEGRQLRPRPGAGL